MAYKDPAKQRARRREYYAANPEARERRKAQARAYYAKNPEKTKLRASCKAWRLFADYKITPAQLAQMLEAQGGVCAICSGTNKNGRQLSIDHCHTTGKVRGLLCQKCNTALGMCEDRPDRLLKAIRYLEGAVDFLG